MATNKIFIYQEKNISVEFFLFIWRFLFQLCYFVTEFVSVAFSPISQFFFLFLFIFWFNKFDLFFLNETLTNVHKNSIIAVTTKTRYPWRVLKILPEALMPRRLFHHFLKLSSSIFGLDYPSNSRRLISSSLRLKTW